MHCTPIYLHGSQFFSCCLVGQVGSGCGFLYHHPYLNQWFWTMTAHYNHLESFYALHPCLPPWPIKSESLAVESALIVVKAAQQHQCAARAENHFPKWKWEIQRTIFTAKSCPYISNSSSQFSIIKDIILKLTILIILKHIIYYKDHIFKGFCLVLIMSLIHY